MKKKAKLFKKRETRVIKELRRIFKRWKIDTTKPIKCEFRVIDTEDAFRLMGQMGKHTIDFYATDTVIMDILSKKVEV